MRLPIVNDIAFYITIALKELIETKHLYQSVFVLSKEELEELNKEKAEYKENDYSISINRPWQPKSKDVLQAGYAHFTSPDVKLFCDRCGRTEAFNHVGTESCGHSFKIPGLYVTALQNDGRLVQDFSISFLCQSCKLETQTFLIRREGLKIILCGRAPIEHVDVPNVIPRNIRRFFAGAIVACQSGQTLAGNFLLRCLIEQWAKIDNPNDNMQADQLIDSYMTSLPSDFKSRFPSLRNLYGELSEDIHNATGSAELFDKSLSQILEHFEARRLFKLGN